MKGIARYAGIGLLSLASVVASCKDNIGFRRPVQNGSVYSSRGMDVVLRGAASWESLSDWQAERQREWNRRNYEFLRCDRNEDGMLTGEEGIEYSSLLIFNYRFR